MPSSSVRYISTRGGITPVDFREAVFMGLATDGGLLLPAALPNVKDRLADWADLPYVRLAEEVISLFVGDAIPRSDLRRILEKSYSTFEHPDIVPVVQCGPVHVMELFHGPTLAFKDIALQVLGNLFEYFLAGTDNSLNIIGATSGDTGSAAIHGVRGKKKINIFIMHPCGKVSPVQERQMTTVLDRNVHNIAIKGTFDDGQRILKEIFNDLPFKRRYELGAVNSVNWARVMAQIVYYFYASLRLSRQYNVSAVQASVPTGNFGDIFAGYLAVKMGAPISRLILATNENDILAKFFNTGIYERGEVHPTISPSMDIQIASNFERYLYYRCGSNPESVKELMEIFRDSGRIEVAGVDDNFVAGSATQQEILKTIRHYHQTYGYVLDPHSAVGVAVAERNLHEKIPTVCLATAHPAKFAHAIEQALGHNPVQHPAIEKLMDLPTRLEVLPANKETVEAFIRDQLQN